MDALLALCVIAVAALVIFPIVLAMILYPRLYARLGLLEILAWRPSTSPGHVGDIAELPDIGEPSEAPARQHVLLARAAVLALAALTAGARRRKRRPPT